MTCLSCGGKTEYADAKPSFCKFCGARLKNAESEAEALVSRAVDESDFTKKRALLNSALALEPECFTARRELAFLGRMGETGGRPDFSRIPSWPLDALFKPREYSKAKRADMMRLLMENALYLNALKIAPDKEAFEAEYLRRMAGHYVELFLLGNNQIATIGLGIRRKPAAIRARCEIAVRDMKRAALELDGIPDELRPKLARALEVGFEDAFA